MFLARALRASPTHPKGIIWSVVRGRRLPPWGSQRRIVERLASQRKGINAASAVLVAENLLKDVAENFRNL